MVCPNMVSILYVETPHSYTKESQLTEGQKRTDMYVYKHLVRMEPEFWSVHYMLANRLNTALDNNIIGRILQMQYGDDAINK